MEESDRSDYYFVKLITGQDYILKTTLYDNVDYYRPVAMYLMNQLPDGTYLPVPYGQIMDLTDAKIYKQHIVILSPLHPKIRENFESVEKYMNSSKPKETSAEHEDNEDNEDDEEHVTKEYNPPSNQKGTMVYENTKRIRELIEEPMEKIRKKLN